MFSDGFSLQNWEIEKMIEMVRNNQIESIKEASREAGRNAGIEESRKQTLINTITRMLHKNNSIEIIKDITGKTKEEIINIKNSMT